MPSRRATSAYGALSERAGLEGSPKAALALAENWRPYRAYALQYLWSRDLGQANLANEETVA